MRPITTRKTTQRGLALALGMLFAGLAQAQWQWTSPEGRIVFSDRAPPAHIPDENIVKRPAGFVKAPNPAAAASAPTLSTPTAAPNPAPPSSSTNNTAAKTPAVAASAPSAPREKASNAKNPSTDAEQAAAKLKAENCARAKQNKSTLESGMRMARINAKGEREVLDESNRAAELKYIQNQIDTACQ